MDVVDIEIAASPEEVYDLVSDITKMGRWSPETYRCEWIDGCTGPRVDARFKGWNKDSIGPIPLRWSTVCTVRTAERGSEFAFQVRQSGATWTYRFAASGAGTRLTETRVDGERPMVAKIFNSVVPDRAGKLQQGMQETLQRIKAAAEGTS